MSPNISMRTALEIPELRNLHSWACETLDVGPDVPLDERTSLFLNQVIENEGFVAESKWQAFQLLVSLERNSVIPARHDSNFANLVHDQINNFIKSFFTLKAAERQQRFKVLQMVASKDTLLSLRVSRLKPFLAINIQSQKLPQNIQFALETLCQCAIASAESRKKLWPNIYAAAVKAPEDWKHAALLLQKQLSIPQSSINDQLMILIEADYSLKQQSRKELKFYFKNFRLKRSPGRWFGKASDASSSSTLGIVGSAFFFILMVTISSSSLRKRSYSSPSNQNSYSSFSGPSVAESQPNSAMSNEIIKRMQEEHWAANPSSKPDLNAHEAQLNKILEAIRESTPRSNYSPFDHNRISPQNSLTPGLPDTPFSPPTVPNYSLSNTIDQLNERLEGMRRVPDPIERMPLPSSPYPFAPDMNSTPYIPGVRP